jgi:fructose/tagatose bisphosphate aldolase
MTLASVNGLLVKAQRGGYGVGAFNVIGIEATGWISSGIAPTSTRWA